MKDRVPGAPGQYAATIAAGEFAKLERGNPFSITLIRDDHPLVEGTPYSKATVLPDEVATILCPGMEDPSPADAFKALVNRTKAKAGFIYPLASDIVPEGFLLCDGREYSRAEYAELFDAIGIAYGAGNGSTTFNVPNLSTRVPVGAGDGYALGSTGGEETHQLTVEEMPTHNHGAVYTEDADPSIKTLDWYTTKGTAIGYQRNEVGDNQAHNNMQPYTVVNYIIATGKGEDLGYVAASAFNGGSTDAGSYPIIVTNFGEYATLAEYIKNGMEDNSAVICYYTGTKLSDFPDISAIAYSAILTWCIEIHKSSGVAEINARASNQYASGQSYSHRWNGIWSSMGNTIDWKQIELYTGAEPGSGGTDSADSIVAQGTSNGWTWRKWSNGFAECWKTVSCSTISGNVAYTTETLPIEIKSNRTILATQSDTSFTAPTTEISKFTSAFAPGVSNPIRIFAQKTENFATGNSVSASVYVCGNYQ